GGPQLYCVTTPLLTTASGAKMGKTAQGAIWLNADRMSPYDFWQFWRNTEDADVGRFLRLFTELPLAEIERLEGLEGTGINEAKKVLAHEATRLCHGEDAALAAAETARKTFEEGAVGESLPSIEVAQAELEQGIAAFELFHRTGLASSKGEARRLVKGGGAKVNDAAVETELHVVRTGDIKDGLIKLSAGRKRHALVKVV
ncbi:MAG: tyrosine--tRNA ligase, partial [Rhodospirillales bacterium]|nr:tyrosine--tRNA ligase [Rhodospirillales bacterium]